MRDIKDLLTAWGNWSYGRIGTEYKGQAVYQLEESSVPMLTDEEALIVDRAVGGLKMYDIDGYKVITAYYQHHLSCRAIGRTIKKPANYITAYLGRAEAYIAGRIEGLLEVA